MATEQKSKRKDLWKYFVIGAVIFSILVFVFGLIAVSQSKENGSDKVLAENDALNSLIYQDSDTEQPELTDDKFISAVNKVFPKDQASNSEIQNAMADITHQINTAGFIAYVSYFNDFGKSGYCISTYATIEDIKALLDFSLCSTYYIQILKADSVGIDTVYKVTVNDTECRYVDKSADITSGDTTTISVLCNDLVEQYGIEDIRLTNDSLYIYSNSLSTFDLLNVFDYTYQWCLQNNCDRQIVLLSGSSVVAVSDKTLVDSFYEKNYPISELAALFRLNYYVASCFFNTDMQTTCSLYL